MNEIIRYNSTDKNIAAVKCYVRESLNGSPLYRDKDRTEIIPKEEAIELFNKGLITVEYGGDDNLLNAKPIFITDGEIGDADLDEEAGYGVIFFFHNSDEEETADFRQLYVEIGDEGPTGPLCFDSDLATIVPFSQVVEYVEKGNAVVYSSYDGGILFAGKPTCVLRMRSDDEYDYEVKFPL